MVYRYKDKWCSISVNDPEIDNKIILSLTEPAITEECSYLLNDDELIDFNLLISVEGKYWYPNVEKIREVLGGYIERWSYPEDKAKSIVDMYSSMIIVDFELNSENIDEWVKRNVR